MPTPAYHQLTNDLLMAGAPSTYSRNVKGAQLTSTDPVSILVNCPVSARPYEEILLRHAPNLQGNELEMVVRSLCEKGMKEAGPFFVSLFESPVSPGDGVLWAAALGLVAVKDKRTFPGVIRICRQRRFDVDRTLLMGLLATIRTDETYELLICCLNQEDVRGHAIAALGRFGRPDAIPFIEAIDVVKGKYEQRAKASALKALRRKQQKASA